MTAEFAGWDEFAKFMADHIFCDIDRDMFLTVVNRERMFNELRENSGTARPCFDDFFLA